MCLIEKLSNGSDYKTRLELVVHGRRRIERGRLVLPDSGTKRRRFLESFPSRISAFAKYLQFFFAGELAFWKKRNSLPKARHFYSTSGPKPSVNVCIYLSFGILRVHFHVFRIAENRATVMSSGSLSSPDQCYVSVMFPLHRRMQIH